MHLVQTPEAPYIKPTTKVPPNREEKRDGRNQIGHEQRQRGVPPITAKGGKLMTAQTSSSLEEDSEKAVTGRMPLILEMSVSQMEGS